MYKQAMTAGALLAALGVILGAFGAHSLKAVLPPDQLLVFETGVRYEMYHSFALLVTGIAFLSYPVKQLKLATAFFIIGIALFSGSLYAMSCLSVHGVGIGPLGILTPIGGLFFILGWVFLTLGDRKEKIKIPDQSGQTYILMKAIALIPARLGATRFPSKMLAPLRGKSVIRRTYESAVNTGLFDQVVVVTDSDEIMNEIISNGGNAVKSKREYQSGTDRIAEVAADMETDVFVNVQGDEPFVQKEPLAQLLDLFRGEAGDKVQVASLVQRLTDPELIKDPNYVKVALALDNSALFFSRSVIPYPRDTSVDIPFYEHIGVYAFRKQPLMDFTNWAMTPLEAAEKVECLRFLEHGVPMHMAITQYMGVEIDTPEDIIRAEKLMAENGWV